MPKEELIKLLELLNNASDEKREELINKYSETIANVFYKIPPKEKEDIIITYNALLYDMGLIKSAKLTPEERERRRLMAMSKPKFSEKEEAIRQIFIRIFNEEPYWLNSKKALSRFRKEGINITPPQYDANLKDGYLDYRPKGYSICLNSGLPFFYIYIGEDSEDIFLYVQKKDENDLESKLLNDKAIQFLVEVQKAFASRTPDTIYLSSSFNEEDSKVIWTETSSSFDYLIFSTGRSTSGRSNIVSLSDGATHSFKNKNNEYSYELVKNTIDERFAMNGNPTTIKMLNELRATFDLAFNKENDKSRK